MCVTDAPRSAFTAGRDCESPAARDSEPEAELRAMIANLMEAKMGLDAERERALEMALAQIERSFGKGSIMRLGEASRPDGRRGHPDRRHRARPGAGRRRHSPRAGDRDLRSGVVGQDDAGPAHHRRGAEDGRRGRAHRRRARARSRLRRRTAA